MSEFRQDLVSGDWVIIAPGRAKRPDELIKKRQKRKRAPKAGCPFEDLEASGNWPPLVAHPNPKHWDFVVIPNKYPALSDKDKRVADQYHGIYKTKSGVGEHELVIGRDHDKGLADLTPAAGEKLFEIFQGRYEVMSKDSRHAYVSAFLNWGPAAGASIWHPHYQILALPIIPPHITHSLHTSREYHKKYGRCVRCDIVRTEQKEKTRIIAENAHAMAIAPFASKRPFEVSILPKAHTSFFEQTSVAALRGVAALSQTVLRQMKKQLQDPDLHLFIHSAPVDGQDYSYHHWHIEIVPVNVVSPAGGFEISTIVNINVIDPDDAAKILRKK